MEPGALLDLDTVLQDAWEMEPLPASLCRLAQIVADEDSDLHDIVEVVAFDQMLTAKLLRAANSAANAGLTEITTVNAAVQRLGSGAVLSFAMAAGVQGRLNASVPEYELDEGSLWRHSVSAALAVQLGVKIFRVKVPPEAYTAALLHDIGKLLLSRFLEPELLKHLHIAQVEGGISEIQAEAEILGVNHAELGGIVAQRWELPDGIGKGIHFHHDPDNYNANLDRSNRHDRATCDMVHIADVACHMMDADEVDIDWQSKISPGAWERLGLDHDKCERLADAISENLDEVLTRYE